MLVKPNALEKCNIALGHGALSQSKFVFGNSSSVANCQFLFSIANLDGTAISAYAEAKWSEGKTSFISIILFISD